MKSKKWLLNARDIIHGFLMAFGGSVAAAVGAILSSGAMPTWSQIERSLLVGAGVGIFYLLKNWTSNSEGKILSPEPPKQ